MNNQYIFHADCHGLQSICEYQEHICQSLTIHCVANPQRFPVYGMIELEPELFDTLKDMLSTEDSNFKKEILNTIKERIYSFPVNNLSLFIKNMKKIPNDELDPFWGSD